VLPKSKYSVPSKNKYKGAFEASRAATGEPVARKEISTSKPQNLWDAQKVDEDSFSKDGITCAVG